MHQIALSKDAKMVYRFIRKFKNGRSYNVFLLQKNFESLLTDDDLMYQIILKDTQNANDLYELNLTLKQTRDLFSLEGSSKEEVEEILIHFKSNKNEFIKLLNSLDISEDNEVILDFKYEQEFDKEPLLGQSLRIIDDGKETFSH